MWKVLTSLLFFLFLFQFLIVGTLIGYAYSQTELIVQSGWRSQREAQEVQLLLATSLTDADSHTKYLTEYVSGWLVCFLL